MFKKLLVIAFLLTIFALSPQKTSAKVIANQSGVTEITQSEVIDDDLFIAGELVQIDGVVNGDVYAGGETVRITGVINGDVHIGAGKIDITGTVDGDIYMGAGEVILRGATVGDSV